MKHIRKFNETKKEDKVEDQEVLFNAEVLVDKDEKPSFTTDVEDQEKVKKEFLGPVSPPPKALFAAIITSHVFAVPVLLKWATVFKASEFMSNLYCGPVVPKPKNPSLLWSYTTL